MSARMKTLGVVFSLTLNLAFLGAFAYHRFVRAESHARNPIAPVPVYEQLDLTPQQRHAFVARREELRRQIGRLGGEFARLQGELIDLVAAPTSDRDAIDTKQEEIRLIQASVQSEVIEHLLAEAALLRPEQRQRFFALVKERIATTGGPAPLSLRPGALPGGRH